MNRTFLSMLMLFLLATLVIASAQQLTPAQQERIHKLEKIIQDQNASLGTLEKQLEHSQQVAQQYTEQIVQDYANRPHAEEAATIAAGHESKGFFIRSADGNLELYMSGFIQAGLGIFENHSFDHNSFYLNGAELVFDLYLLKDWHGRVQFNFYTPSNNYFQDSGAVAAITLKDAYVEYIGVPEINVRVGQFHVPFTIEGQYGSPELISSWSESFIRSWGHGRDVGIMFLGTIDDMFEYKLSLQNGEGRKLNETDEFLVAAGVRLYPFKKSENANSFFHVGVLRSRDNTLNATGDINATSLYTPWGRTLFDGVPGWGDDYTQGWKTGVDVGGRLDMYLDSQKVSRIRFEGEYMYMTWERNFDSGRLPHVDGIGFSLGILYQYNLTPEVEGAGIFPMFKVSYATVDNKHFSGANDIQTVAPGVAVESDILGQTMWTYTFGLGYAFNKYVSANFNWVMVDIQQTDVYGGPKDHTGDLSDDTEHAWFFQVTAQW
jgi:hypothetical protein